MTPFDHEQERRHSARQWGGVMDWQSIETAPKDGTPIVAWCVHPYATSMTEPAEYVGPVIARWIDHNGGGWTWHGHLGNFTHWLPLPPPPQGTDHAD